MGGEEAGYKEEHEFALLEENGVKIAAADEAKPDQKGCEGGSFCGDGVVSDSPKKQGDHTQ